MGLENLTKEEMIGLAAWLPAAGEDIDSPPAFYGVSRVPIPGYGLLDGPPVREPWHLPIRRWLARYVLRVPVE